MADHILAAHFDHAEEYSRDSIGRLLRKGIVCCLVLRTQKHIDIPTGQLFTLIGHLMIPVRIQICAVAILAQRTLIRRHFKTALVRHSELYALTLVIPVLHPLNS